MWCVESRRLSLTYLNENMHDGLKRRHMRRHPSIHPSDSSGLITANERHRMHQLWCIMGLYYWLFGGRTYRTNTILIAHLAVPLTLHAVGQTCLLIHFQIVKVTSWTSSWPPNSLWHHISHPGTEPPPHPQRFVCCSYCSSIRVLLIEHPLVDSRVYRTPDVRLSGQIKETFSSSSVDA